MLTSESITKIMPAFLGAQSKFAPAVKGKDNPFFKSKYVPLDAVIDAVAPALRDHKIVIMQQTDTEEGRTVLITKLIHESGEWIAGRYPVHPIKSDPQAEGSALTYARRYALMALVGIAPEDDDGNSATAAVAKPITEGQIAFLQEWIDSTDSDVGKFCGVFGCSTLGAITAGQYEAALSALKKKASAGKVKAA